MAGTAERLSASPLVQYGRAVGSFLAVALVRLALEPTLKGRIPFLLFLPAILYSSWFGGFGPGALALLFAGAFGTYLISDDFPWQANGVENGIALRIFLDSSTLVLFLAKSMRRLTDR